MMDPLIPIENGFHSYVQLPEGMPFLAPMTWIGILSDDWRMVQTALPYPHYTSLMF